MTAHPRAPRAAAGETPLRSRRGLVDEAPGLYDDEWLATWRSRLPELPVTDVEHMNHDTILMGQGVDAVAESVTGLGSAAAREQQPVSERQKEAR